MNNLEEILPTQENQNPTPNPPPNPNPLIIMYINKYYKAPEHIKTEDEFRKYLETKESEMYDFISNENLKINHGRINIMEWDGGETIKNKIRTIAKTEQYDLYKSVVDLDYIIKYFGFNKKTDNEYLSDTYDENFITNNSLYSKKIKKPRTNIVDQFNYASNSDNDNDNDNIIDDEELYNIDNTINDKDYESDN
jgi:hypothetical protein